MFDMQMKAENIEIRGKERKTSAQGKEYLIVRVEDETGKPSELYDPNVGNEALYIRGTTGTFALAVQIGKYSKVSVINFIPTI
jgi:hypothetical protein